MCGIAGRIGNNSELRVREMVRLMHHRGPDDNGVFSDDSISIGMARLSIIDLSSCGHQPMRSSCGRYWIVYNGECYNFREIRTMLEKKGKKFVSASDTEVVLEAYITWGRECLKQMNGMFAFAIWDTLERKLFAARDRLGIKPFYYAHEGDAFVFASEVKALVAGRSAEADHDAVFRYFTFGYVQQPATVIAGVKALMPGHFLEWKDQQTVMTRYWDVEDRRSRAVSYEQTQEELIALIRDAVRYQLVSDRPLGLFLSGGLDSASVLAAIHTNNVPIKTFSIGFEENPEAKNELKEAEALAAHFGARHRSIQISSQEAVSLLPDFLKSLDQPSVDGLNTYLVSKYAVQDLTVALSGLGGDELFGGYARHALLLWKSRHKGLQWLSRLIPEDVATRAPEKIGNLLWRARAFGESDDFLLNYTLARTIKFPTSHERQAFGTPGVVNLYEDTFRAFDDAYHQDTLRRILRMELRTFMSSLLLRDMDAVSMAHSLEVRFPLIDHRLVEFAFDLPDTFKLSPGVRRPSREGSLSYDDSQAKKVLVDAMRPLLPAGFMAKSKNGFKLPINRWLRAFPGLEAFLFDRRDTWSPYFDDKDVRDMVRKFIAGESNTPLFWRLFTFAGVMTELKVTKRSHS